jgi:acetylornithine/N-succinyldiaminopimelate aminotransferase
MFSFQHAEIRPDILTLGKGIGGGVPLAAVLAREEICLFEPGEQGGTFNGNPLMTAVGCAVVGEISRPEFLAQVSENGEYLAGRLRQLSTELGLGEVRGRGLLLALELGRPIAPELVQRAFAGGLLINAPKPGMLRFMPALNVTRNEIDEMLRTLHGVTQQLLQET